MTILWAVLILLLGLVLLILEMFIPSAGILAFLSTTAIVGSIFVAFKAGAAVGIVFLAAVAILLPLIVAMGIQWWPHTPIGKRILNLPPGGYQNGLASDDVEEGLTALVGQCGRAKTKMLPSGAVEISGRTYDAVSEGVPIDPGQVVEVIRAARNRIVVRPTDKTPTPMSVSRPPSLGPMETILPDPFDDRLS